MLYFCMLPAAENTVDQQQLSALQGFREWSQSHGLVETFFSSSDFKTKLQRHVQIALQKNDYLKSIFLKPPPSGDTQSAQIQQPVDECAAIAVTLSPEAEALLIAAANDDLGAILDVNLLAGRMIQTNNQQFGQREDRRSMAKWDYGLQQLLTLGLIERVSTAGEMQVFQIVERGFRVAESISKRPE